MTEVDHISAAWVERKLLDALDQIEGRVDGVEDKLTDVELGVRAVVKAYDQNKEVIEAGFEKINELVGAINALTASVNLLIKILSHDPGN
jgi:hypothetical protein